MYVWCVWCGGENHSKSRCRQCKGCSPTGGCRGSWGRLEGRQCHHTLLARYSGVRGWAGVRCGRTHAPTQATFTSHPPTAHHPHITQTPQPATHRVFVVAGHARERRRPVEQAGGQPRDEEVHEVGREHAAHCGLAMVCTGGEKGEWVSRPAIVSRFFIFLQTPQRLTPSPNHTVANRVVFGRRGEIGGGGE